MRQVHKFKNKAEIVKERRHGAVREGIGSAIGSVGSIRKAIATRIANGDNSARLARIQARKEVKLMKLGNAPVQEAQNQIQQQALATGSTPQEVATQILENPKAQTRLQSYVQSSGMEPASDPMQLAQQAQTIRQGEIFARMEEPSYQSMRPEEVENELIQEEYDNNYLPEVLSTEDYENFSNFVDPATWSAVGTALGTGVDATRSARFARGKKFLGETEAQYKKRTATPSPLEEAVGAGIDDYKKSEYMKVFITVAFVAVVVYIGYKIIK